MRDFRSAGNGLVFGEEGENQSFEKKPIPAKGRQRNTLRKKGEAPRHDVEWEFMREKEKKL